MLEISQHFLQTGMTTPGRSLWTILTVSVFLMCAYSVELDCQEMEACTDKLRDMNHTIINRLGTSQMIKTCIQLTQNHPMCFEPATKTCELKFVDTIPYRLLYHETKASCNKACPIFQPLLNCETMVAYVDLSTDKNNYCRSYIESMECLESILVNITCSFGEETRAYILDTVYDQSSRQFGDGVCMAARECTDIDKAVMSVKSCLRQWNLTRDHSDSGTDALKSCISKITTCSDALKMVPFFEKSLVGIDITVPLTTETPETSSTVTTTTASMTSTIRSPSSSTIDTSVRTSNATRLDIVDVLTKISREPLETTDTTKGTSAFPDQITTSFSHKTSTSPITKSSNPKTSSSPIATSSNLKASSSPTTTSSNIKTKIFQINIFPNHIKSTSPITTSSSHQTNSSHLVFTSRPVVTTEKNDPPTKYDSVTMETESHSTVVQTTVVSSRQAISTEEENGATPDVVVNASLFSKVENEMITPPSKQLTTKSGTYINIANAGLADRQDYSGNTPPRVNDGTTVEMHEKVPSSVPAPIITPELTTPVKTSTIGREVTRTLYSSGRSRIVTSRLPLKSESVTGISTEKSVVTSTSVTSKTSTSYSKGAQSGDTNGCGSLHNSRATAWILLILLSYFLT